MCTPRRARVRAYLDAVGVDAPTAATLVLAGLFAVNIAAFAAHGISDWLHHLTAAVSLVTVGLLIFVTHSALADSERFREVATSYEKMLNDYFLVSKVDALGRFCEANENLLRRTGYSLSELANKPIGGLSAGVYSEDYLAQMWEKVQSGQTWSGEFCDRAKDGTLIWVKAIVVPLMDARGELQYLKTISVDVTEQHGAEEEAKRAHARLEAFIKHAPAAVAMFDNSMRYVAHTARWLQDYHLEQKSLVGLHHYDVFPEIPAHWRAKHKRILAGATETCEEERFERSDGSQNVIRWEVRPWYMLDDSIGGIIMLTEDISERKKMQDQLWALAKFDTLTGLPNRLFFNETLRDAIQAADEKGTTLAVALMDLDHFKEINDTLGHDAGDDLLKTVANRLQMALGGAGTIARLGGDEFAVLILSEDHGADIPGVIQQIEAALSEPITIAGTVRSCTASIGVTVFPRDATQPSDLLKNADLALYRAKSLGRGRTHLFTPDLRAAIDRRVELQEHVFDALQRDQFQLYFQPIVPADPGQPPSFEALLRWKHPVHGVLSPGDFEEVFDDPRVAAAIGERVIDMALTQAAAWSAEGIAFARVAINVASADFAFGCFASRLKDKLAAHGILPERICIEVTERVFLGTGTQHVSEALELLDQMGVEIALDDFGTGYASLSHIKAYPIGRLKIDRSFVHDMESNRDSLSIVQAIIQLGSSLGLAITAEGVETEAQVHLLRSMGCGRLQGYYFSRPLPAHELGQFLGKRKTNVRVA